MTPMWHRHDKFHQVFNSDYGRDHREFWRMLTEYQTGNRDYRAGMDRVMVTMTGYRPFSLMKLASGIPEEQL